MKRERGRRGEGRGEKEKGREKEREQGRVGWESERESILNSWGVGVACGGTATNTGCCGPVLFTKRRGDTMPKVRMCDTS